MARRITPAPLAALGALALVAVPALPGTAGASVGAGVGAAASAPSPVASRVVVVLRDQHPEAPASAAGTAARLRVTTLDQAGLQSAVRASGGAVSVSLHALNAFAATVSPQEQARLAVDPAVAAVLPDRLVAAPKHAREAVAAAATPAGAPPRTTSSTVCPTDPSRPLLEPEALQLTHTAFADPSTPSAQHLATGRGVRVAFLADGIGTSQPDFIRADGSRVFVDYQDFSGDGPQAPTSGAEAFGDASAIAAQGRTTYDLSHFVNPAHPLPAGCTIRVLGMAPDAELVGLKVFPAGGFAFNSAILAALDHAVTVDHVDVVNESFGSNQYPDTNQDPTALFNAVLARSGVTVVASSGDAGGESTVGSPATTPGVIAVAGTTMFRGYMQTGQYGTTLSNGSYLSNNISALSSSGVTQTGGTVDLVAPGDLGWALCSRRTDVYVDCVDDKGAPSPIQLFGGTSQSSPLTAGAAADVIQAYRDAHAGRSPAPALVEQILTSSADDLGLPGSEQGAGLLNTLRAVQTARSVAGTTAGAVPEALLASPTQVDLAVAAGTRAQGSVTVTNTGSRPATLTGAVRSVSEVVRDDRTTVVLSPKTDPTLLSPTGLARSYVRRTFTVPAGASRLAVSIAWPDSTQVVRFALLDPRGTYSGYDLPQGLGNFGLTDVRNPLPGTWTAVLLTPAQTGYAGPVSLQTTSFRTTQIGTVGTGRIELAPGQGRAVTFSLPGRPAGDYGDTLTFSGPDGVRLAVPVVVRSLVSTGTAGGTFSGSFGGGNGRSGIPNPSRTYAFDVPAGQHQLAASVTVPGAGQQLYAFLVDPAGEPVSERTNLVSGAGGSSSLVAGLTLTATDPAPGRWQLVFAVFGPLAGTSTTTGFSGEVRFNTARVTARGLPTSAATVLPAGRSATATISLVNTGVAGASFFADGRLSTRADLPLVGTDTTSVVDPAPVGPFAAFRVPTQTDALSVSARADHPVLFEVSPFPADHVGDLSFEGDPDVEAGPVGRSPSVTVEDPTVAPQTWLALPSTIGPFAGQGPRTTVHFSATAHTRLFDPAITSSTGDPLLTYVQAGAPTATPLQLASGDAGTITVRLRPTAPRGTVVTGVLYLDSTDPVTGSTQEVAALPYAYRVG